MKPLIAGSMQGSRSSARLLHYIFWTMIYDSMHMAMMHDEDGSVVVGLKGLDADVTRVSTRATGTTQRARLRYARYVAESAC